MCQPTHFEVSYVINPWMAVGTVDRGLANAQWMALSCLIATVAEVVEIPAQPGLPDMVFTANAGVVLGRRVVVSHFRPPERRGEEKFFRTWFGDQGFAVYDPPPDVGFEGAGDCLFDADRGVLWTGFGQRTEPEVLTYLQRWTEIEVVPLQLSDPRFYHLDTCFCPLEGGHILYFPGAFSASSHAEIERRVSIRQRLPVSSEDAVQFACNSVNIDQLVIMNAYSKSLAQELGARGYSVETAPVSEFIKAGGSVKCLTLRLDQPRHGYVRREYTA